MKKRSLSLKSQKLHKKVLLKVLAPSTDSNTHPGNFLPRTREGHNLWCEMVLIPVKIIPGQYYY